MDIRMMVFAVESASFSAESSGEETFMDLWMRLTCEWEEAGVFARVAVAAGVGSATRLIVLERVVSNVDPIWSFHSTEGIV